MGDINNILASSPFENGAAQGAASARGRMLAAQEEGRKAAIPLIPGALAGSPGDYGKLIAASPETGAVVGQALQRMDTHQKEKFKQDSEWTAGVTSAILQAPVGDRARLYGEARAEAQRRGIAADLPEQYDENRIKFYRDRAIPVVERFKADEQMRRHVTPGARAAGGDGFDPLPGAPAAAPPGRGASAGPMPGDAPAPVFADASGPTPPGTFAPPDVARATQPGQAPQTATAGPPVGPQGNPILSLPGRASASVGADMPSFAVPSGPFPASGAPSPGPLPQEGAAGPAGPAAGPPPGFQAMGHRTPDGQLVPALINGQPVFRNPQTGEMTLGGGATPAAPAPAAGPDVQLAQGTPPQGAAAPSAPPAGPSTTLPAGAAGVEGLPPGWVQRTKNGVPVIKDGYFYATNPQTGQTVPYKPTERPLPPVGYENDPTRPGAHRFIVGGPADPDVIKAQAEVRKTASEKAIPQTITKGMQENLNSLKQIDRVESELAKFPDSTGGAGSILAANLPGAGLVQNRIDKDGVRLRALISDIGSMKIHDRSGAAVTASEFPRLKPFIPSISDDAKTIRDKLANFRAEYSSILADTAGYYGPDNGFKAYTPATDYLEGKTKGETGTPAGPGPAEKARDSFNEQKAAPAPSLPAGVPPPPPGFRIIQP